MNRAPSLVSPRPGARAGVAAGSTVLPHDGPLSPEPGDARPLAGGRVVRGAAADGRRRAAGRVLRLPTPARQFRPGVAQSVRATVSVAVFFLRHGVPDGGHGVPRTARMGHGRRDAAVRASSPADLSANGALPGRARADALPSARFRGPSRAGGERPVLVRGRFRDRAAAEMRRGVLAPLFAQQLARPEPERVHGPVPAVRLLLLRTAARTRPGGAVLGTRRLPALRAADHGDA